MRKERGGNKCPLWGGGQFLISTAELLPVGYDLAISRQKPELFGKEMCFLYTGCLSSAAPRWTWLLLDRGWRACVCKKVCLFMTVSYEAGGGGGKMSESCGFFGRKPQIMPNAFGLEEESFRLSRLHCSFIFLLYRSVQDTTAFKFDPKHTHV